MRLQEAELLKSAKEFAGPIDEEDLLAQLQHYGSVTNLIDFTTDYFIALFFACDGKPKKDGRVILLKKNGYKLLEPRSPANRVIAQKSVFVRPPKGYIEDRAMVVVPVPHHLKEPMLEHLGKHHNVRAQTIYNDLHGFIRYHQGHESAYLVFYDGVVHQLRDEVDEAIESYRLAISLNPQLAEANNNRGVAFSKLSNYNNAIKDYTKAIELNPYYTEAYNNLGEAYIRKGDFDSAIRHCNTALKLNPGHITAYFNRGIAFKNQGEVDRAIQDFDMAIGLSPNLAEAYVSRGNAYCDQGEYDRAIQDYNRAIELDPGDYITYTIRGAAFWRKGDHDLAIQDYDQAIKLNSCYAAAYNNRGIAFWQKGNYAKGIRGL